MSKRERERNSERERRKLSAPEGGRGKWGGKLKTLVVGSALVKNVVHCY